MTEDKSKGYERISPEYISGRGSNRSGKGIGASTIAAWARFLFTAPQQAHSWTDAMTGLPSRSLGYDAYQSACKSVGLTLIPAPPPDAGGNYYYLAQRATPGLAAASGTPL